MSFPGGMAIDRVCPFCQNTFAPSQYHPNQKICSQKECQKKRRVAYHHKKLLNDPSYYEQCRESRKQWRQNNKGRLAQYRTLRKRVLADGAAQRAELNRTRLLSVLKKASVFDLRQYKAQLWVFSLAESNQVEKILADANIIILQAELSCSLSTPE